MLVYDSSGDKEGEGLAAGSGSEDDLTFYNAASSTGGSAASCYTTVAADSSEEEAENGPTTSPAGYTDDLSPTARQLARVMEICGTCATDKLGADPDNGGSLLMRMAPQGPAKVSEGRHIHPSPYRYCWLPSSTRQAGLMCVYVCLSVPMRLTGRAAGGPTALTVTRSAWGGVGGKEGRRTFSINHDAYIAHTYMKERERESSGL